MPNSGLRGPYALTGASISKNVTKTSAGAYALGSYRENIFRVSRVGRSDGDVANRIRDYIGSYSTFKYDYFSSAKAAFDKECHLYHDFSPPDNVVHPARPSGTSWKCPRCDIFG